MRIGLDLDDTICSTKESIKKYVDKYCSDNNIVADSIWNDENKKNEFLTRYLKTIYSEAKIKKGAKAVINRLKKSGYDIYIITARRNKYIDMDMKDFIINYLSKNGIIVDDVILDSKDKVDVCKNMNIDIILEDNSYNYNLMITAGINVVLFDEFNINKNIKNRINNWNDFLKYII